MPVNETLSPKPPRYRYVLFDWDGCLAQTLSIWMNAYVATFEKFGLFPEERAIARQMGDWHGPKSLGVSEADYQTFIDLVAAAVRVELPQVALYPGALDLVHALKERNVNVCLNTTTHPDSLRHALQNSGLAALFDVVITSVDVTNHKPHAESIELALARMGGSVADAVMIGDSSNDLGAAKNAGTDSILVYPPAHELFYDLSELQHFNPTYVCATFEDVKEILLP